MKVLLLNPVTRDATRSLRVGRCQGKVMVGFWPNIEYGYLGAMLQRDGFQVQLLDANALGLSWKSMLEKVRQFAPDLTCILSITATVSDDVALGHSIAAMLPNSRQVFWGTHATVLPHEYLSRDSFVVIRREPEMAALELCRHLRDNGLGSTDLSHIPGLNWREQDQLHNSPDRPFLQNLEEMPHPSHELMGVGRYLATDIHRPFALIKTSRGCPNQCVFCTSQTFHGDRWRPRDPASVVEEVAYIIDKYGIRDFFFQSDVFSKRTAWTRELCQRILDKNLKIRWFANSRVDSHDAETLQLMKRSGCRLLAFGVESGSDIVLKTMKKGATSAQAAVALEACRKAGITSLTYWVFGLPGETSETMAETLRFIDAVRPDYAHFYAPTPLPGSRLFHEFKIPQAVEQGDLKWEQFFQGVSRSFVTPEVDIEEVQKVLRKAYFKFYSDPRRIAREMRLALGDWRQAKGRLNTFATMVKNYVITD